MVLDSFRKLNLINFLVILENKKKKRIFRTVAVYNIDMVLSQ